MGSKPSRAISGSGAKPRGKNGTRAILGGKNSPANDPDEPPQKWPLKTPPNLFNNCVFYQNC
eukprot:5241293-Amphidinium_carterae.1